MDRSIGKVQARLLRPVRPESSGKTASGSSMPAINTVCRDGMASSSSGKNLFDRSFYQDTDLNPQITKAFHLWKVHLVI
jgi:hypothetical protein